jgi:protein-L-isoaspartate(D-aspartate) O-methyltransferase
MNIEQARFNMVEQQIRSWEVLDPQVIDQLFAVKRELFVPARYCNLAFADTEIPLGHGAAMLAPRIEARAVNALKLKPTDKVLEIGTGSGYFAALLAAHAQQVHSVEIVPELVSFAKENLSKAGVANVKVENRDGLHLGTDIGQYDIVVLSGAVSLVPPELTSHLKIGGRLLAFVGDALNMEAQLIVRSNETTFTVTSLFETVVPMLVNGPHPSRFSI